MSEYEGTMRWFGARFDAPMYDGMPQVPTPVGETCGYCCEPILEGEPGITMPFVTGGLDGDWISERMAIHYECNLRSIMGSPAHLDGLCSCHGGSDHSELTYRQQANVVMIKLWGSDWRDRALAPDALTQEGFQARV